MYTKKNKFHWTREVKVKYEPVSQGNVKGRKVQALTLMTEDPLPDYTVSNPEDLNMKKKQHISILCMIHVTIGIKVHHLRL
jgi:hypothetical protein